jgi:alanine racemase
MTPNTIHIDLDAITHNYRQLKQATGAGAGVMAVIKSDAYGHGMVPVAKALEKERPPFFAVFELEEAISLRQAGCTVPILILLGISEEEAPLVVEQGFTVALFDRHVAEALSRACLKQLKHVPVHLKVDTGMTRLGVPWEKVAAFLQSVRSLEGIRLDGIFSHFAVSDEPENPFTAEQMRRFKLAVKEARKQGLCENAVHMANSGAVLQKIATDLDLVRPGISLYGSSPAEGLDRGVALKQAMTFTSRIVRVEKVKPQTPISYGCTYRTKTTQTIATIPVGYDDGFSRLLSNRGEVLVRGFRVPVVGRTCMNLTMIDVTHAHGVSVGDEVVLLGAQGGEIITAEELARKTGTISYEIYCTLGKSNFRTYGKAKNITTP